MCGTESTSQSSGTATPSGAKGVSDISFKSALKGVSQEKLDSDAMEMALMSKGIDEIPMARGDGASGGGGHSHPGGGDFDSGGSSGGSYYIGKQTITTTWHSWKKSLAIHTGVPTWKERLESPSEQEKNQQDVVEVDGNYYKMHFGEIPSEESKNYNWYFLPDGVDASNVSTDEEAESKPWSNPFTKKFNFFTNDLSGDGISNYSWPFYYDPYAPKIDSLDLKKKTEGEWKQKKKQNFSGVLTNMWAGCEPVCAILSKLLKDGFFCSYPWNVGLGYMFRKSVPKLVFVFANEFDNSFTATYDYYKGFIFQTPLVIPGIKDTGVTFYKVKDVKDKYREPLDPFCVKQLKSTNN